MYIHISSLIYTYTKYTSVNLKPVPHIRVFFMSGFVISNFYSTKKMKKM